MSASLSVNAMQVDFASVITMEHTARTDSPRRGDRNKSDHMKNRARATAAAGGDDGTVGGGVRRVG
ncbi:hypothetical protein F511_36056 [Dorcoceras hygrometricum]|uniref:Uncharacterized protein n=1 Tax=Dorcoceras hygrometricum TaxID=472368 RepID=A0A2Z7ATG8_9LAMI|nr:hypothetical protein F511_36056 [Dorcoceras hygrometricum]